MELNPAFWSGRRVLLTGHTGFKGGWLALWLHMLGANVRGYALPAATTPSLWQAARLAELTPGTLADIRDSARVNAAVTAFQPDVVLHLAAQPLVRASYEAPADTYATNVMGTVHLLEAVRRCTSVRAVVVVTSDKCYDNRKLRNRSDQVFFFSPFNITWLSLFFFLHANLLFCNFLHHCHDHTVRHNF